MGQITTPQPVKLLVGMLAPRTELFDAVQVELVGRFGPVDMLSDVIPFDFTDYYEAEMGPDLLRKFVAFEKLINPRELAGAKLFTNDLEESITEKFASPRRIVNLDPGYITLAKLVLASTKDYSHRIYLGDGIFTEVTLHYADGRFNPWPWTYPDYKTEAYHKFFEMTRKKYRDVLRKAGA